MKTTIMIIAVVVLLLASFVTIGIYYNKSKEAEGKAQVVVRVPEIHYETVPTIKYIERKVYLTSDELLSEYNKLLKVNGVLQDSLILVSSSVMKNTLSLKDSNIILADDNSVKDSTIVLLRTINNKQSILLDSRLDTIQLMLIENKTKDKLNKKTQVLRFVEGAAASAIVITTIVLIAL